MTGTSIGVCEDIEWGEKQAAATGQEIVRMLA
jgi:hypothetical protein